MPMLETAYGRLSYFDNAPANAGAPTVMLLHSSAGSHRQWKHLIALLGVRWRVIAPDLIGYGDTPMTPKLPTMADEVTLLSGLLNVLDGPVHLIGHSYGGSVGLELTRARPERIASLALYEPTFFAILRGTDHQTAWREIAQVAKRHVEMVEQGDDQGAAQAFLDYWIGRNALQAMPESMQAYIVGCMAKVAAEWRMVFRADPDPHDFYALTMPMLLLYGSETTMAARHVLSELQQRLPGARVQELPGLTHMAPLTQPQPVNATLLDFLESALPSARQDPDLSPRQTIS